MGRIGHMSDNEKKNEKETEAVQTEAAEQAAAAEAEVKAAASTVEEDSEPFVVKLPDKEKKPKRKERREQKKNRILNITPENDIKYLGPLNYRWMKLIGWACIAFAQFVRLAGLKQQVAGTEGSVAFGDLGNEFIASLGLPLILIANFAIILNGRNRYKSLLILNGGVAAFYAFMFWLLYHRYTLGLLSTFQGSKAAAAAELKKLLAEDPEFNGYITFNVFLDMFLLILFMYFLNYVPKKKFQGEKLKIFRLLALLPMLYEAICILLRLLATGDKIVLPISIYPFLTTKPPLAFVMFICIAFYVRGMEKRFTRNGKTHEEYVAFTKTNTNSFMFSKKLAKLLALFAVIDFIMLGVIIVAHMISLGVNFSDDAEVAVGTLASIKWAQAWGSGDMVMMVLAIPIVLLFSYTKPRKLKIPDILIPLAGVVSILFIYLEGIYQIIQALFDKGLSALTEMG